MAKYNDEKIYNFNLFETFLSSEKVDFLLSQKHGANYVLLFQMLCLKTTKTDGILARKIGNVLIKYDEEKLQRDLKYFSIDTVRIALMLFEKLGLIYQQDDGTMKIADYEKYISYTTVSAEKRKDQRKRKKEKELLLKGDICRTSCRPFVAPLSPDKKENTPHTPQEEKKCLIKILKKEMTSAGAYTGVHDKLVDEVLMALVNATQIKKARFGSQIYTGEAFKEVAEHLTLDQVCAIVNRILGREGEIYDREKYIQGIIANHYAIAEE